MYILFGKTIHLEDVIMKHFYRKHKKLFFTSLAGILFVGTAGCLMHFVYEWSGQNSVAGLFAPVSESTWEHMKLVYFPMLLFFLAEYMFLYKQYPRLLKADLAGILTGTLLIPVIFYTYTGILGTHSLPLDILTFIISAAFGLYVRCRSVLADGHTKHTFYYFICALVLGVCFLIFTYYPPDLALFISP